MRNILSIVLILSSSVISLGQSTNNSPYSYYGLGELGGLDHATMGALGNAYTTVFDSTTLNFYNPATYNTLSKGVPLFSFGISSRLSNFSEGSNENFSGISALNHFALAFPIKNHFGFAFGFKPYSRRGYSINSGTEIDSDSLHYNYEGTGGANEVFLGLSSDLIHLENTRLAVGINGGYVFGGITNTKRSYYDVSSISKPGGVDVKSVYISAFHYQIGFYFTQVLQEKHTIRLAGTFEPSQKFGSDYSNALYYANNVFNSNAYDTLNYNDSSAQFTMAPTFKFGAAYILDFGKDDTQKKRKSQLAFHLNYSMTDWSGYNDPYDGNSPNYLNTVSYNFGVQFIPETDLYSGKPVKFHEKLRYRAGIYQYSLPFETNGEQVKDFGTTFGIGLPVTIGNAISSIDLGFSYGRRGIADQSALSEGYYGLNFGLTISPDKADRWFRKRKLN